MRLKLFVASLWTLGLLFGMLFAVLLLALYSQKSITAWAVLGLTVIFNFLMWLVSPKLMDWTLKFFYKATFYNDQASFSAAYPPLAGFINQTVQNNKTPFPKIRVINDDNPTAYSFGSGKWNARVVYTQGILDYLQQDEVEAVLAHELGHIVHRDFIVMSIANAIIQLLYEIYYILARSQSNNNRKGGQLVFIGWIAYIFYFIGTYIVLYLNRLREYYADEFSAETLHQGDALSRALIKVAYGIMAKEDSASSARLLESTKTMGIMSLQSAKSAGLAMKVTNMQPDKVARVMLFDVVSPWAKLAEISSTHPLTGKRILRLQKMDMAAGKPAIYDLEAARQATQLDKGRLWGGFLFGGFMYFMTWIVVIGSLVAAGVLNSVKLTSGPIIGISFGIIFILLLMRIFYRYPSMKRAQPSDIYTLMTDLYANPVRGRPVQLNGSVVGKGVPGYVFSEDVMIQDNTGLLYIDYQGRFPLFSNLYFALKKVKALLGQDISAKGWFYRSNTQFLQLKDMKTADKNIRSYPRLWSFIGAFLLAGALSALIAVAANASTITSNRVLVPSPANTAFNNDIKQAKEYWQNKNYTMTVSSANDALDKARTNQEKAIAYYWRGVGEYDSGNYAAAKTDETQSIGFDPTSAAPHVTLGAVLNAQGDRAAASQEADKAISLDPSYAWAYNLRGIINAEENQCTAALTDMNKAVSLEPTNTTFQQNLQLAGKQCGR